MNRHKNYPICKHRITVCDKIGRNRQMCDGENIRCVDREPKIKKNKITVDISPRILYTIIDTM
jgi:hypothetical protein